MNSTRTFIKRFTSTQTLKDSIGPLILKSPVQFPINAAELEQFEDLKNDYWKNENLDAFLNSFATGLPIGLIELKKSVFGLQVREDILARCLKYEESWFKQSTESTKTLGQVRGSSKKQFPQKGRGKARVGSHRAPQFVGGYNVHGPRPHNKTIDIQQKVYDLGIKTALSAKFRQNQIIIVDEFDLDSDNYLKSGLKEKLNQLDLLGKKSYFINGFDDHERFTSIVDQFTRKLKRGDLVGEKELLITSARHVSCHTLLEHEFLIIDKEGLEVLEELYSQ